MNQSNYGEYIVNEYNLFFDSNQRTSGTISNPIFNLPQTLVLTRPDTYFKCQVKSLNIPYAWSALNSNNNTFVINQTGSLIRITVDAQCYANIDLLMQDVNTVLLPYNLTFSTDASNAIPQGKTKIVSTNTQACTIYYDKNSLVLSMLGITANLSVPPNSSSTLSQAPYNLNVVSQGYIRSNSLQLARVIEAVIGPASYGNILETFFINVPCNSFIQDTNLNPTINRLRNTTIDSINFFITDNASQTTIGAPVPLALDWCFQMVIQEAYNVGNDIIEDKIINSLQHQTDAIRSIALKPSHIHIHKK
jgi:hypothetical protein